MVLIIVAAIVAVILLKPASEYAVAKRSLDEGDYIGAYHAFVELGDYSDSSQMADKAAELAYDALLEGNLSLLSYTSIFELTPELYHLAYDPAVELMSILQHDSDTKNWLECKKLMDLLPDDYKDCAVYKKLFGYLSEGAILCQTDLDFIEENWSLPYVQTVVLHKTESLFFLEGEWKTEEGERYFSLQRDAKGSLQANYNLPVPETSVPAVGYSINGNIYTLFDAKGNPLGTAFTFSVIDFNHIKINCMADDTTYVLTRE